MDRRPGRLADGARLPGRVRPPRGVAAGVAGRLLLLPAAVPRPPWRLLHLDLLVLASLSVSLACFSDGNIDASVPLAYPPLLYLLVRLLQLARHRRPPRPLRRAGGPAAARRASSSSRLPRRRCRSVSSNVIDVGYAGVIGADRLAHCADLYGSFPADNPRGDTYGPLLYLAYLPFELVWPWHGHLGRPARPPTSRPRRSTSPARAGLYLAASRRRGPLLAYLWLACPVHPAAPPTRAPTTRSSGVLVLAAVARAQRRRSPRRPG